MRDLKILIILIILVGIIYIGVEPLAHHVMYPAKISSADYSFKLYANKADSSLSPNVDNGKKLFSQNCVSCHSMKKEGMVGMDTITASKSFGVNPPDLSIAGAIYSTNYLRAFITNPAKAARLKHVFKGNKVHPMPSFGAILGRQGTVDIVAYLKNIAKNSEITEKAVFVEACNRCHAMRYDNIKLGGDAASVKKYLGKEAPDLSQMIRSRGEEYIITFINNPQQHIHGTAMPTVGLNKLGTKKIIDYLEKIGDSSKPKRDSLGWKVIIFFILMAILAYLWKKEVWKDLH